jgi:hypothetical protein
MTGGRYLAVALLAVTLFRQHIGMAKEWQFAHSSVGGCRESAGRGVGRQGIEP